MEGLDAGRDHAATYNGPLSPSRGAANSGISFKSPRSNSPEFAGFFPQTTVTKENTPPRQRDDCEAESPSNGHKTPDSVGKQSRSAQASFRRRSAAEWITKLTGAHVPSTTDHAFRRALKDGTLLCRILNLLRPGCITRILEPIEDGSGPIDRIQTIENVSNFLTALQGLQFPTSATFSLADIESTGWEDRPRVAECVLTLKRFYEGEKGAQNGVLDAFKPFLPVSPVRTENMRPFQAYSSPQERQSRARPPTPHRHLQGFSQGLTPDINYGDMASRYFQRAGPDSEEGGLTPAMGVTRMMQQCTQMLKDRMRASLSPQQQQQHLNGSPSVPPFSHDTAIESMGPIVESVLGSLTQEYENRLQSKDHEVSAAQHEVRAAHTALKKAQEELYEMHKAVAENSNLLPVCSAQPGMTEEEQKMLEAMRHSEQALKAELDSRDSELQRRIAQLTASQQMLAEHEAEQSRLLAENSELKHQAEEMAPLAEKYATTVEENRLLYNQVQDLKGNIRVFCRIRPAGATGDTTEGCTEEGLDGELALYNQQTSKRKLFKFDKIFGPASTQDLVYDDTKPLIRSVLDGYNVCIFAYGQTGSGKTHTMSGTNVENESGRGINYRALDDLFALNASRQAEVSYEINVQLLEIYNEQLRDLLDTSRSQKRLDIRSTERSGVNVPDAIQRPVACTEDVLEVMNIGAANRSVAETKMNERSSRSHSVLTIIVDGTSKLDGTKFHGCLHLIDLAGSERVGRSEATGDRLEEAKHINRSLSALGDVMSALANKDRHVPFRNSKLTQLLQDSLQGQAKAMMFIHIAPEVSSFSESISTLTFGSRVSEITLGAAKKNVESGMMLDAREAAGRLQREAAGARAEAAAAVEAYKAEIEHQREQYRTLEMQYRTLEMENARLKAQLEGRAGGDASASVSSLQEAALVPVSLKTPRLSISRSATPTTRPRPPSRIRTSTLQGGFSSPGPDSPNPLRSGSPGLAKVPSLALQSKKSPLSSFRQSAMSPTSSTGSPRSRTPQPSRIGALTARNDPVSKSSSSISMRSSLGNATTRDRLIAPSDTSKRLSTVKDNKPVPKSKGRWA